MVAGSLSSPSGRTASNSSTGCNLGGMYTDFSDEATEGESRKLSSGGIELELESKSFIGGNFGGIGSSSCGGGVDGPRTMLIGKAD